MPGTTPPHRRSPAPRAGLLAGLLAGLVLALTGCGGSEEAPVRTAENGAEINDADVEFATGLLQHAAEGLLLADLTLERDLGPDLSAEVEATRTGLLADVEQATTWLEEWGEEVPETARDHANAGHGHGDGEAEHEGEHADLAALEGADFEEALAGRLEAHHEEAVALADTVRDEGHDAEVASYAAEIADRDF